MERSAGWRWKQKREKGRGGRGSDGGQTAAGIAEKRWKKVQKQAAGKQQEREGGASGRTKAQEETHVCQRLRKRKWRQLASVVPKAAVRGGEVSRLAKRRRAADLERWWEREAQGEDE